MAIVCKMNKRIALLKYVLIRIFVIMLDFVVILELFQAYRRVKS